MKLYLKSGQVVEISEVQYAVAGRGKDYVDRHELPMLKSKELLIDVGNKRNDDIIEFFGKDNCLCFTTYMKQIIGIAED